MLADLYRFFHYTTTPPAATTIRLTQSLNDVQREILTMPGLRRLRDDVLPITAKANVARAGLPTMVGRIQGITDRGNNRKLWQVTLDELRLRDPAQKNVSSAPERYAVVGYMDVILQPATTGLWAVSSAAGDTTQTVYVETITTGGYPYLGTIALNGSTRVQMTTPSTRTDHIEVTRLYLSATAVGYVSLYDAATVGNELARIEPGRTFARYLTVEWHPIQSADVTLYADFTRVITNLVNGTDEPLLPEDFHPTVVDGARQLECLFSSDARVGPVSAMYEKRKRELMDWVMNNADRITSMRKVIRGRSSLTGMGTGYPADGWWY